MHLMGGAPSSAKGWGCHHPGKRYWLVGNCALGILQYAHTDMAAGTRRAVVVSQLHAILRCINVAAIGINEVDAVVRPQFVLTLKVVFIPVAATEHAGALVADVVAANIVTQ